MLRDTYHAQWSAAVAAAAGETPDAKPRRRPGRTVWRAGAILLLIAALAGLAAAWAPASWRAGGGAGPLAAGRHTAGPLTADARVIERISGKELLDLMQAEGYSAYLDEDEDIIWTLDGLKACILRADDGSMLQCCAGFGSEGLGIETANAWNRKVRHSRAYVDGEGDFILELEQSLSGGVTRERIAAFLRTCRASMAGFVLEMAMGIRERQRPADEAPKADPS
jgi:hypothetical protein